MTACPRTLRVWMLLLSLWTTAIDGAVVVEVSTLDGRVVAGRLSELSARTATVETPAGPVRMPAAELLEVRCPEARALPADADPGPWMSVRTQDGAAMSARSVTVKGDVATLVNPWMGAVTLPRTALRSLRIGSDDAVVRDGWKQLLDRTGKRDLLVIRKGEVLDHLDGVAGAIDADAVRFLVDGDEVTVKREKVFGIIYARSEEPGKVIARVDLLGGDVLLVREAAWNGMQWRLTLPRSVSLSAPAAAVQSIDFSISRVAYLSAPSPAPPTQPTALTIEPREIKHTPFFNDEWEVQRDRDFSGRRLRVGSRTFTHGLAVHSRTLLRYRLAGEYRRFQAWVGLDPEVPDGAFHGDAHVVIRGDGKVLFESDFIAGQPPETLDLPVIGVNDLELFVDYGRDKLDIGDRVHFGDARVVK